MANAKVSALTELAEAPNDADLIYVVDVSDTTDDAAGTSKKITASNLKNGLATASALTNHTGNTSNPHSVTAAQVNALAKDNTTPFTPSGDYHPATKKYVDDTIVAAGGYTDENAQDAVGGILTDTNTIDFTYNDAEGQITADVKDGSITLAKQANMATTSVVYRKSAGSGAPEVQTLATLKTDLGLTGTNTGDQDLSGYATTSALTTGLAGKSDTGHTHTGTYKAVGADETANVSAASESAAGKVELATTTEATTGTDTERAVTPAGVKACTDALNSLTVTAAPSSDTTASGLKVSLTAGETLAFGNVCYIKSDGKAWKADADGTSTYPGLFMATGSISADASGTFLALGVARNDAWNWTVGGFLYLSATAGDITQTAPSTTGNQIQILGVATHADRAWFYPQIVLLERA